MWDVRMVLYLYDNNCMRPHKVMQKHYRTYGTGYKYCVPGCTVLHLPGTSLRVSILKDL